MAAYATVQDVGDRWIASSLPPDDATIEKYLHEAKVIIDAEYPRLGVQADTDDELKERLRIVSARMVIRSLQNPDRIRQIQDGSGPYNAGVTYAAELLGDMQLTADDRAILTGGRGRKGEAFTIHTGPRPGTIHREDCNLRFGALYCSCGSDLNRGEGPISGFVP